MIGIDTNILVRYLMNDDKLQAKLARRFIEQQVNAGEILWISQIVLCELVWVLKGAYRLAKKEIENTIDALLRTSEIRIENSNDVHLALDDYRKGSADFADCLIGRTNTSAKCKFTVSFDQRASELKSFKLLK